jgi:predicted protein tyrosine phosphatase
MPTIHVCPLHLVPREVLRLRPAALMTLLSPAGQTQPTPPPLRPEQHFVRYFHDIPEERPDLQAPSAADVAAILQFVDGWDRSAPLLVHCFAGVSRSTATAYMAACRLAPAADEHALALALRAVSPTATPNARMIALADALLGRQGRMIRAIAAIGTGQPAAHGEPFELAPSPS